ncbi:MAG: ElyC/SanA/YdcF family protein [bacterium]
MNSKNQNNIMTNFKLFECKERWGLTWLGRLILFSCITISFILAIILIHPFLAENHPIKGEVLVVEGWLPDYALKKAITEFNTNNYSLLFVTGVPLLKGYYLLEYETDAGVGAATLEKLGFNKDLLRVVPAPFTKKDRTYTSAIALKQCLAESKLLVRSINLVSLGPHSRRSRLLFEKAFGKKVSIGVVAVEDIDYDPDEWWRSSNGVRMVIGEAIAYIYARFFSD